MKRQFRVWFYTICATTVSVAIWSMVVIVNLLAFIFGDSPGTELAARIVIGASAIFFFVLSYRHFAKTEP